MLRAPFSSEFDPSEEGEGSIDPLGLQPGYERLADRLLPAVTVRMGDPRLVTAMAAGACVCEGWDADVVAADEITPPWLVWEWFVVEAFVRAEDSLREASGVPGTRKVRRALRTQRPVSASSYLKTPTAFGFTGVFQSFADRCPSTLPTGCGRVSKVPGKGRPMRIRVAFASLFGTSRPQQARAAADDAGRLAHDPPAHQGGSSIGNHIFQATGVTDYLSSGGPLEHAHAMAAHFFSAACAAREGEMSR